MKKSLAVLMFLVLFVMVPAVHPVGAAEPAGFEPVRAPSKGPDKAPVTILEIVDFM